MNPLGIDPTIFTLGPLEVRWYGLMYVLGFLWGNFVLTRLAKSRFLPFTAKDIESYITWLIVGMFIGARTFYVFIYNWAEYAQDPSAIFAVWQGGLSFHGAITGMVIVTLIMARKRNIEVLKIIDSLAIAGSLGIAFGRIGNFINGELYGRVTDSAVGMVFAMGGPYPRHASQLYEAALEGVVLFLILWWLHKRQKHYGVVSASFLIIYGVFRYFIEFFREADVQLGYYFGGTTTMGQILCFLMIIAGGGLLAYAKKKNILNPLSEPRKATNS